MIIDYLADNLGCGCTNGMSDAVEAIGGAQRPQATEYIPPLNSPMQSTLYKSRGTCPKSIGHDRGDVNVNVNVSNMQGTSSSTPGDNARQGGKDSVTPTTPSNTPASVDQRAIEAAVVKALESRPSFESKPVVEYRPFAVPTDRIVKQTVYKPFNVVWDRIKTKFINRDVNHPIDRVRKVPQMAVRSSFEGPKR